MEPLTLSNQRFPRFLNCHSHIQFLQLKVIQDILAKSKNVSPIPHMFLDLLSSMKLFLKCLTVVSNLEETFERG